MKSVLKWAGIIVMVLFSIGVIFGDKDKQAGSSKGPGTDTSAQTASSPPSATEQNEPAANSVSDKPEAKDNFTVPQKNAIRSAKQYLSFKGFSRRGLIQQLSSDAGEGYSVADATIAVDSLAVDWNQEAEKSAKQYLEMQGFSCKGLVAQLSSSAGEGFTVNQARYGAKQAGAC